MISGAFIRVGEWLGIKNESKSARMRLCSGIFSLICYSNLKVAVGANILLE